MPLAPNFFISIINTKKVMKILFICKNNQFRSQMATAIYNEFTRANNASSAGTYVGVPENPEGVVIDQFFRTTDFFELMEKHGMFIRKNLTKRLLPEMLHSVDIVVSMAEEPFIPDFLRKAENVIWWNVENPTLVTRDVAEKIFAQIYKQVEGLITKNDINYFLSSPKNS